MHWLGEQHKREQQRDEIERVAREAEINALLHPERGSKKSGPKQVRRAIGGKLVEWGERLQDTPNLPHPSTSKI